MSQLEAAQRHLAQALERLEDAPGAATGPAAAGDGRRYQRAFAAITAERNDLARNVARCAASATG